MTCGKTQGFLAQRKIDTAELVDARKTTLKLKDALRLLASVDEVYAAKGRNVERLNLKAGKPDRATVEKLLIGPTGNLRAPTLRIGRTLLGGFDEATYRKVLG